MTTIAHLGGDLVFARGERQLARFIEIVRQRFLAVNVFAEPDGGHRGDGVVVVGNRHDDGVDVLLLKQLSEIAMLLRAGMLLSRRVEKVFVHVAEGDDVLVAQVLQVLGSFIADADEAEAELLVERVGAQESGRGEQTGGSDCRGTKETTTSDEWLRHDQWLQPQPWPQEPWSKSSFCGIRPSSNVLVTY